MKPVLALSAAFFLPALAHAQTITTTDLGAMLLSIVDFINAVLVPFLWAVAFIFFLWGIFTYFIAGAAEEEKRAQGRTFAVWGIIAFFVMSSIWGIVNLVRGTFQFGNENTPPLPGFNTSMNNGTPPPSQPPPEPNLDDESFFQ